MPEPVGSSLLLGDVSAVLDRAGVRLSTGDLEGDCGLIVGNILVAAQAQAVLVRWSRADIAGRGTWWIGAQHADHRWKRHSKMGAGEDFDDDRLTEITDSGRPGS